MSGKVLDEGLGTDAGDVETEANVMQLLFVYVSSQMCRIVSHPAQPGIIAIAREHQIEEK